ncbi:unnamed protein product [Mytilus coruscus]|uniref:Uncharacterized protein n=1 Tax=Mytilus coruscus TaxID=42192 RepID=A0A6J8ALY9_MYTCO|nr:unnamed protein product [Mytilus coruscus]
MDLGDEDVFLTQNKFSQAFENEELVEYGFFSHHESLDFLNLSEEETTVEKKDTNVSNHSSQPETDSTSNCSDANGPEYRHKLPVTAEEISNLIVSAIPQSTRGHYKWGYNVFSNWQNERRARPVSDNLPIPVEAITQSITEMEPCIRDTTLQYFLAEVKKTDGNDYPSASLYQLFVALQGQIRLSDPSVNLLTQPTYVKCRKVLDSVMKKRSAEGLGAASRRRAEPISSLEENILWERAVIGSDNPPKLLDTMVYFGIHLALRGGRHIKISKTNSGGIKDKKYTPNTVKDYENVEYPGRCIVTLFEKYKRLCPKDEVDAFYFKPLVNYTTDQWFCKVPVGHNILQNTVKRLCTAVGLEGKRTNHSHRSYAVRSYKRTVNFQQNESSEILYGEKQKTTTCTEMKLQSEEEKTSYDTSHQVVNIESVRRESVAEPTTLTRYCGWRQCSCDNGNCVYITQFCDRKDDCGDNSDEKEPCFRNNY